MWQAFQQAFDAYEKTSKSTYKLHGFTPGVAILTDTDTGDDFRAAVPVPPGKQMAQHLATSAWVGRGRVSKKAKTGSASASSSAAASSSGPATSRMITVKPVVFQPGDDDTDFAKMIMQPKFSNIGGITFILVQWKTGLSTYESIYLKNQLAKIFFTAS